MLLVPPRLISRPSVVTGVTLYVFVNVTTLSASVPDTVPIFVLSAASEVNPAGRLISLTVYSTPSPILRISMDCPSLSVNVALPSASNVSSVFVV